MNPYLPTYLSISINMEPEFRVPSHNGSEFKTGKESGRFLNMGKKWLDDYFKKNPENPRNIQIWSESVEGHTIFLPRYFRKLAPPTFQTKDSNGKQIETLENEGLDEKSYQKCARFVSLIPFKIDS